MVGGSGVWSAQLPHGMVLIHCDNEQGCFNFKIEHSLGKLNLPNSSRLGVLCFMWEAC